MRADKKGFTIIELLVVLVVLGILAAIGLAKFTSLKEQAYVATMKADLRNLAVYQMTYWDANASFFSGDGAAQGFIPSPDVTVNAVSDPGPPPTWSATAAHPNSLRTCAITTSLEITCP
ncbi:MAG: prepilin-type N-terminal cleavage/methylation domain-containing protein [Gemmatimonadaceae bacterium]